MDGSITKFKLLRNLIFGAFVIIIIASMRLQIVDAEKYSRLSEKNRIRQRFMQAPRGKILDRYGIEIANTRPGFYVSVIKALIDETTLREIAAILGMDEQLILDKAAIEKNPYMAVKIAHDISYEQLAVLEEKMDQFKGIELGVEPLRNYPYGELFSHLVGYVDEITKEEIEKDKRYTINNYVGRMGLEQQYEHQLKGSDGIEYIEVDARGREVGKITEKRPTPVTPGKDLYTTIDAVLTESVAVYLKDYERASCVCLDPRNGDILVLYSKPGFDPNMFIHGLLTQEWQLLNTAPGAPMYNRSIMSCYPCGSTFKPFVALAALDANMVTKDKYFNTCEGAYQLGRRIFRCWKEHGRLNLTNAIIYSCDIYFYQLGAFIGIDTLASRAQRLGFGKKTGIDLPGEKSGLLPNRAWFEKQYGKNWTEGHMFNVSIGQGDLLVTPLQLACAYTVFANNGRIPVPHVQQRAHAVHQATDFSEQALDIVKKALTSVVLEGTGALARVERFTVSGKTGTAQNPHGNDHSLFVGYAPDDNPQILVCVFVENAGHGGSIAAPIAGKVIRTYLTTQRTTYAKKI